MSDPNPLFSIVVPTYNRSSEVTRTINYLINQSYKGYEIVVVDDCSTLPIVKEQFKLPVKVVTNIINRGAAFSRNIGVKHAIGKWILFLDDDDVFLNNKLIYIKNMIDKNPECNFIYHRSLIKMVNESVEYESKPERSTNKLTFNNMLIRNQVGGTSTFAIKKELFDSINGFDDFMFALEDYEFLLRLVKNKGFKPCYIDKVLSDYNCITKKSSVSKDLSNTIQALDYIEKVHLNDIKYNSPLYKNYAINRLKIIALLKVMKLDRGCSTIYFKLFKINKNPLYLFIALLSLISPKSIILIKSFIN